jgi:hypothetical protein
LSWDLSPRPKRVCKKRSRLTGPGLPVQSWSVRPSTARDKEVSTRSVKHEKRCLIRDPRQWLAFHVHKIAGQLELFFFNN